MKIVNLLIAAGLCLALTGCSESNPNIDPIEAGVQTIAEALFVYPNPEAKELVATKGYTTREEMQSDEDLAYLLMDSGEDLKSEVEDVCTTDGVNSVWQGYQASEMFYIFLLSDKTAYPEGVELTKNSDTWYDFTVDEYVSWQDEPTQIEGDVTVDGDMIVNFHFNDSFLMDFVTK